MNDLSEILRYMIGDPIISKVQEGERFRYLFYVRKVKDGDTISGDLIHPINDKGFKRYGIDIDVDKDIRFARVNTPETAMRSGVSANEKLWGLFVKEYLQWLLKDVAFLGLATLKDKNGKYAGRIPGDLWLNKDATTWSDFFEKGVCVNDHLYKLGYALPVDDKGSTYPHPTLGDRAEIWSRPVPPKHWLD